MNVYLDYNGSAPLTKEVEEYLIQRMNKNGPYANPNANHYLGMKCSLGIEKTRGLLASTFSVSKENIVFNSGATEGISSVFNHIYHQFKDADRKILVLSDIEHSATINSAKYLEQNFNYEIVKLNVLQNGQINTDQLKEVVSEYGSDIKLISVMAANNETGVIQPVETVGKLAKKNQILYFCDATQVLGKSEFDFSKVEADFLCCSGHKIGALTGIGALIVNNPDSFTPLIIGGNQENGMRGGTQNYIGIETLGIALENLKEKQKFATVVRSSRDRFEAKLKELFPKVIIFGEDSPRVCNTSYFSIPGLSNSQLQQELQLNKIFVTTGSACSDKKENLSHVLVSMGFSSEVINGAVRLSCVMKGNVQCFDYALNAIREKFHSGVQ